MKKMNREKIIKLLKNNKYTYNELSKITGYHPKSLIRINSQIKNSNYEVRSNNIYKNKIINKYLNSNYTSYIDFYKQESEINISYQTLCKILRTIKINQELLIIKKIKNKNNNYFEIIDYETNSLLLEFKSLKNDTKSTINILYNIFNNYGVPKNILFINFYKEVPPKIEKILKKYKINIIKYKSIYKQKITNNCNEKITYKKIKIDKTDFYNEIKRKTISNNIVQFNNTRFYINTNNKINKNEIVTIYYNDLKDDIFIKYNNNCFKLEVYKTVQSKKGNSKYN